VLDHHLRSCLVLSVLYVAGPALVCTPDQHALATRAACTAVGLLMSPTIVSCQHGTRETDSVSKHLAGVFVASSCNPCSQVTQLPPSCSSANGGGWVLLSSRWLVADCAALCVCHCLLS
jgi:hypothetical protein